MQRIEQLKTDEGAPLKTYRGRERRRQERLEYPFPAKVQAIDVEGSAFDVEVKVENVCAGGFYARLPRRVERGTRLSTTIRFSTTAVAHVRPKFLAVHGTVRRVELHPDGTCGVAVEFEHHQFL